MAPSFVVFLVLYMMSFLFIINSDDWFLIWLGLEINMLSFIFLIYIKNDLLNIETCLKYFFVQSLGSAFFMSLFYLTKVELSFFSSIILSYKMGAGFFYFWFPSTCLGMSWMSCFVLMSFQKLLPLMLMFMFISWILWIIIFISLVVGVFGSFNQCEMKLLMAYSSIHHIGWMIMCMLVDKNIWLIYLLMYSVMIIPVFYLFMLYKVNFLVNVSKMGLKLWLVILMLNMSGMPPMLGFFLKWMSFYYILKVNLMMILMMIFMSLIMFYIYLRVSYDVMLGIKMEMSWKNYMLKLYHLSLDFLMVMGLLLSGTLTVVLIM